MHVIKIQEISTSELLSLMREIAEEIETRLSKPEIRLEKPAQKIITVKVPDESDKDFCLFISAKLKSGEYINASDRSRVADIAAQFPEWVARQGLPTTRNAGDWRRQGEFASSARARAR